MNEIFVSTSVARRLIARMDATHDRARISVFSGPPGIGKTTAIDAWRDRHPGEVAVVKIARQNARELIVLQHVLEAVQTVTKSAMAYAGGSIWELRVQLFNAICGVSGLNPTRARRHGERAENVRPFTIVFDEAQNLSREAIEAMRYWNDRDRCYSPYPVGLIFVGNSEFSLAASALGGSVISAAVADRALYVQTFEYDELTDDDLTLVVEAHGVTDAEAIKAILRAFRGPRSIRSLRRVLDLIGDLRAEADERAITVETVRSVLTHV